MDTKQKPEGWGCKHHPDATAHFVMGSTTMRCDECNLYIVPLERKA